MKRSIEAVRVGSLHVNVSKIAINAASHTLRQARVVPKSEQ